MAVHEEELPGIGRKFELLGTKGERIDVVIHHSGRRDVYVFESDDEEADATAHVQLSDDQARRLGAVLSGVYFKPTIVEEIEKVIGEFVVDWITLSESSTAAGKTIADLQIRKQTGMSVIAVVRGTEVETSPDPYVPLEPGDRLVVVGPREDFPKFIRTYG